MKLHLLFPENAPLSSIHLKFNVILVNSINVSEGRRKNSATGLEDMPLNTPARRLYICDDGALWRTGCPLLFIIAATPMLCRNLRRNEKAPSIPAFLERDRAVHGLGIRTVQRYEVQFGLPIRRAVSTDGRDRAGVMR